MKAKAREQARDCSPISRILNWALLAALLLGPSLLAQAQGYIKVTPPFAAHSAAGAPSVQEEKIPVYYAASGELLQSVLDYYGYDFVRDEDDNFHLAIEGFDLILSAPDTSVIRLQSAFRGSTSLVKINEWNAAHDTSKAYVARDGEVWMKRTVYVKGGLSRSAIQWNILEYLGHLKSFQEFMSE